MMGPGTPPFIREAKPGEEQAIHDSHMRSIREVCIKDHGAEEVKGWGYREFNGRWVLPVKDGKLWVVEFQSKIHGHGCIKLNKDNPKEARILSLYFTPEILRKGLGKKIINLMIDWAKSQGLSSISLESTITSLDFYKKFGFRPSRPMEKHEIGGYPVSCFPMIRDI